MGAEKRALIKFGEGTFYGDAREVIGELLSSGYARGEDSVMGSLLLTAAGQRKLATLGVVPKPHP